MSILVVGGNGFMGRALCRQLKAQELKHNVWSSSLGGSGLDPESGQLRKESKIPEGTEQIIYLSQSPRYRDPKEGQHLLQVNAMTPLELLEDAGEMGVKKFVYLSTGSVYAPSFEALAESAPVIDDNWYKLSKLTGEKALQLSPSDVEVCCVRPFGVFGPGQSGMLVANLIASIKSGKPVSVNRSKYDGDSPEGLKISLCYVDDAVRILLNLLSIKASSQPLPSVVNLAGVEPISIRHLAETISESLGTNLELEVQESSRDFDLVAETTLMESFVDFSMTPFNEAIEATIKAES